MLRDVGAPCPSCGRDRVGSFRFCLACGFDYEPHQLPPRPDSADAPIAVASASGSAVTPDPNGPSTIEASGAPAAIATEPGPSEAAANAPGWPGAGPSIDEGDDDERGARPGSGPWSMSVEPFEPFDPSSPTAWVEQVGAPARPAGPEPGADAASEATGEPTREPTLRPVETRLASEEDAAAPMAAARPMNAARPAADDDVRSDDEEDLSLGSFALMLFLGAAFVGAVFFAAVQFLG